LVKEAISTKPLGSNKHTPPASLLSRLPANKSASMPNGTYDQQP